MQPLNLPFNAIAGYRLIRKLGSGGMGDVYKGYHSELERTAAIKILHQPEMADRFRNEAYIQSGVNHPNIARLYEFTSAGNKPCIIMEYVDGDTLDDFLRRKTRLNNEEAVAILKQIAAALAYLHGKQIHHRDIKPQNFKVQQDGTVKTLDFGIAKHRYTPKFTREGYIVGTTEYMAPEQFEQRAEMKSDIWSLGVLAYEMMTGFMPFEAGDPATQRVRLQNGSYTNPKILVPALSDQVASVIERCLRVNPRNRASASEVAGLLKGKDLQTHSIQPNQLNTARTFLRTRRRPVGIGLGSLAIILFVLMFTMSSDPLPEIPAKDISTNNGSGNKKEHGTDPLVERKITINVPGIQDAQISFPDGTKQPAPFQIKGSDGDQVRFTISATGYKDKQVQLELRMGPQTYDFILDKLN